MGGPLTTRTQVLDEVAGRLVAQRRGSPLRVGVDGVCGAGKSRFARDLVVAVERLGRPALHLDSDGFHHVRAVRHRRQSAQGYYQDAYDFEALTERVLRPLGDGHLEIATRVHDLASDAVVSEVVTVAPGCVVVFDCTFLQRGSLRTLWDEVIWLEVALPIARARGIARDSAALGGAEAAAAAYDARYLAACRIYLDEESPRERAGIVVGHDDPAEPRLIT